MSFEGVYVVNNLMPITIMYNNFIGYIMKIIKPNVYIMVTQIQY